MTGKSAIPAIIGAGLRILIPSCEVAGDTTTNLGDKSLLLSLIDVCTLGERSRGDFAVIGIIFGGAGVCDSAFVVVDYA